MPSIGCCNEPVRTAPIAQNMLVMYHVSFGHIPFVVQSMADHRLFVLVSSNMQASLGEKLLKKSSNDFSTRKLRIAEPNVSYDSRERDELMGVEIVQSNFHIP